MSLPVKLSDIEAASERLHPYVKHTPLLRSEALDEVLGCEVYFKPECLQLTGSFKIRGASNKILTMTDEEKEKGIIASSSGNHALGVASAAKMLGITATLVLPTNAPQVKVDNAKKLGAEVIQHGFGSIERYKKLYEIVDEKHYSVVHSFNDPMLIAGQGTVGYEIMQDLKDVDTVVVPLGGGGVLAGASARGCRGQCVRGYSHGGERGLLGCPASGAYHPVHAACRTSRFRDVPDGGVLVDRA